MNANPLDLAGITGVEGDATLGAIFFDEINTHDVAAAIDNKALDDVGFLSRRESHGSEVKDFAGLDRGS